MGGTGLQLCIDPEDLGTLALIIYLAALRLTLAPVLGGSAAPSPKKNCSICRTIISWCWPSGVFSRRLEAGQLPAGGFGSTVPGFGQVGDGGPQRSG